jgi:serine/threonine-protein kinase RsbW
MPTSDAPARAELTISADVGETRRASAWMRSSARAHRVPKEQRVRLEYCLDETLANVIRHGGPTALASPVRLQFDVRRTGSDCTAELRVADGGLAFDPASCHPEAMPRPTSLDDASPGGLGLILIRQFCDDLVYRRSEDRNHLTIIVNWNETA